MRLSRVGKRFEQRLKLDGGPHFMGQFLTIPDTTRVSNFNSARRILRCSLTSPVTAGATVVDTVGIYWLVGEHGVSVSDHHYFKLFQAELTLTWTREGVYENAITGVKKSTGPTALGTIKGTYERQATTIDGTLVEEGKNLLITNAALLVGDFIDKRRVVRVDHQIGLYIAEVEG